MSLKTLWIKTLEWFPTVVRLSKEVRRACLESKIITEKRLFRSKGNVANDGRNREVMCGILE